VSIDRKKLVSRHDIVITEPDSRNPLSLGNGNFGCGVDITGMQTFIEFHDPINAMFSGRQAVNTATQSSWGWHEMPNPDGFVLADAMTEYQSPRGPVSYPDKFDMRTLMGGSIPEEMKPGVWLNGNPQRIDLGRVGLVLGDIQAGPGFEISDLSDTLQRFDLWAGRVESRFKVNGVDVIVHTCVHPERGSIAFEVESSLLQDGLGIVLRFPYASDSFFGTSDWTKPEKHRSRISISGASAIVQREMDGFKYDVRVDSGVSSDQSTPLFTFDEQNHTLLVKTNARTLDLVVSYAPEVDAIQSNTAAEVFAESAQWWREFWSSGAAISFDGTADPRALELERRVVLSQYLTAANCAGDMPPQETGLMTNSWQGKSHLEMHFWHAAHFAAWGRPELLQRSLAWYATVSDSARNTAVSQGYEGLRWPKQVGPDGRDSPSDIGPFLIWQQPHILYLLELLNAAGVNENEYAVQFDSIVEDTAKFMVSFLSERDGILHLPSPVIPAQEFYDPKTTEDPTFELAYWWWGLEIAQRWNERRGRVRKAEWSAAQRDIAKPMIKDSVYTAIATEPFTKRDDHPALLMALGVVPPTPIIDPEVMRATLHDVMANWEWASAWGWDFPVMAMTANALGEPNVAVDALMMGLAKNSYLKNGHNPQMGNMIPIYLPANGGLLAAIAQMVTGFSTSDSDHKGFPESWKVQHEGFVTWPS